jgi:lipoprotein-anchoring transpeptidase ErfK/SrfK
MHKSAVLFLALVMSLSVASVPAEAKKSRRKALPSPEVYINIDVSTQQMNVRVNGDTYASWDVSTGKAGHRTPRGSWRINRMARVHWSKQFNAPLPHAMFFVGGVAIHATKGVHRLGTAASHGCVRLAPDNAARLFALVKRHGMNKAQVTVTN